VLRESNKTSVFLCRLLDPEMCFHAQTNVFLLKSIYRTMSHNPMRRKINTSIAGRVPERSESETPKTNPEVGLPNKKIGDRPLASVESRNRAIDTQSHSI
jgi:hypothetical protein